MTDDHFSTIDLARKRLERLSEGSRDLGPAHQTLVQDVLEACSASVAQLQAAAEERERLLAQIREDQELLEKLETDLKQERKIRQRILQHTEAHLAYLDPEFNFVQVNETYAQGSGYPVRDLIGRNHFELFPHAENQALFEHVRDTGEPFRVRAKPFEFPDQPERGVTYWNWTLEPATGEDDHVEGLVLSLLDVTETVKAEQALQKLAHDLGERVKELRCLHNFSSLVETPGISMEEICAGLVELIPPGWQYPEVTCARVILNGKEYSTANFSHSPWQQTAEIWARGEQIGSLEVAYLQERPEHDDGPFLREERELLDSIARRLGKVAERIDAQRRLEQQHHFAQLVLDSLAHPFYVINVDDYTVMMANQAACIGDLLEVHTCYALVHGKAKPCAMFGEPCTLQEVLKTKKPVVVEHVHLDEQGKPRAVEVRGYPITDREGNVVQMIEYILDITERKEAEQALHESEANWRSLTETSPDHILMLDTDLKIQFANYASPGLTVDALIGIPLHTLVDEQAQSEVREVLEDVLKTRTPARYETVYHNPHGDDIYYESRVAPRTLSGSDEVVGLTVSSRDITEHKRSEQALRDSEERLRALFEILPVGVSVLDESRGIRFANPALGRVLRLSQEQLQSGQYGRRTYLRADGTEIQPGEFPTHRAFQEDRLIRDVEVCVVMEDGSRIWTNVSAVPLRSKDWRVIATTTDITDKKLAEAALKRARDELEMRVEERTAALKQLNETLRAEIAERQRAEEELRDSEERFRQIAENTEDIIWLIEPGSGRFLYISPAYERILGQSGRRIPETMDEFWADVHPDDRELIPQNGQEEWIGRDVEFRLLASGGTPRWIRARAFPIRDHQGQIYRIGGVASDITEEKHAFAALIEAEQLAIAGRMAASLAHEINNPLQAAIGCLDLSREQLNQGKDPQQHLQVTAQALDRASRVVAQLRALHYPLETKDKQPSDLNRMLRNMLVLTEKRCRDQGVEVEWQAEPDLPPVWLVPDAMEQVCLNLLLNALEAMPQGGRLAASTHRSEDPAGIWIEVSDSGHGIPAAELEHVFEPFYSTKPHSLGLGLFISHNIVLEHGGHMKAASQEGEATTFGIWLPLAEPEVDPVSQANRRAQE